MRKYRKKSLVIEAVQWRGNNVSAVLDFCGKVDERFGGVGYNQTEESLSIPTLEGLMTASKGDYIIRGICGELYPCKAVIFEESYEEILE